MIFLGIGLFLFPYFAGYLIISRIKPMRRFFIYIIISLFTCIGFLSIFLSQHNRHISDILNHIICPTIKFYIQYFGLTFLLMLILSTALIATQKYKVKKILSRKFIYISILILIAFTIFNFLSVKWASDKFPINDPQTVFFVLSSPIEGGINSSIIITALLFIFLPIILICAGTTCFIKKILVIHSDYINYIYIVILYTFIISCEFFCIRMKIYEYPRLIWQALQKPEASEFYQNEYIYPDSVTIQFPEKKRNCIFILLESMESSFADYQSGGLLEENLIPYLTQLASENINFSGTDLLGGGLDLDGTGWTIAAMFAKLAGLPLNPTFIPHNPSGIMSFFRMQLL